MANDRGIPDGAWTVRFQDDPTQPVRLADLLPSDVAGAPLQVRCEHDGTVVAVVHEGSIVTFVERVARSTHDVDVLAPCRKCDQRMTYQAVDGRERMQAQRCLSARAAWRATQQVAKRRDRSVRLDRVLSSRFLPLESSTS